MQYIEGRIPIAMFVDDISSVEPQAIEQLRNVASLPWVLGEAVMPDVHFGIGATIGSVIVQRDALSPAMAGVDLGCGLYAVKTKVKAADLKDLAALRSSIERSVPVGFEWNRTETPSATHALDLLGRPSERASDALYAKARTQLGTLGGGNHFIEVCVEQHVAEPYIWIMLHSGSRNIGKTLAERHITTAKSMLGEVSRKYDGAVIPPDLAPLLVGTPQYQEYVDDLFWCQHFAFANRIEMMWRILRCLSYHLYNEDHGSNTFIAEQVNCHHNYVSVEDTVHGQACLVTRKGAVSAKVGELGIIPGSMGAKSFIVRGRGNPLSYQSCSHGAGRRMSRTQARKTFTTAEMEKQTEGVECRKDAGVLDEIPGAYKDIDVVMRAQRDLVDVVAELKQIICIKG